MALSNHINPLKNVHYDMPQEIEVIIETQVEIRFKNTRKCETNNHWVNHNSDYFFRVLPWCLNSTDLIHQTEVCQFIPLAWFPFSKDLSFPASNHLPLTISHVLLMWLFQVLINNTANKAGIILHPFNSFMTEAINI